MQRNGTRTSTGTLPLAPVPAPVASTGCAAAVQFGIPRPPQQQVLLYSAAEWEQFIREWVHSKVSTYLQVLRFAGAGDMGIDVAGLTDAQGVNGVWDNYQCKHYGKSLTPSVASPEIGKVLWHTHQKNYAPPRKYFFVAPRECGITLSKLLLDPPALRKYVIDHWDDQCAETITDTQVIALTGTFKTHVEAFDYSIFAQRTLLEIIDEHRKTPYYAIRFGGGLPNRPIPTAPAYQSQEDGSRYIQQLFEAYSDHTKTAVSDVGCLSGRQDLEAHFHRQREFFYHAEALRNFARDNVPTGTFEDLQTEVHAGVADIEGAVHADGYARVNAVTQAASSLHLTSNALIGVVKVQDCKGICHQLANEDRLRWRKP